MCVALRFTTMRASFRTYCGCLLQAHKDVPFCGGVEGVERARDWRCPLLEAQREQEGPRADACGENLEGSRQSPMSVTAPLRWLAHIICIGFPLIFTVQIFAHLSGVVQCQSYHVRCFMILIWMGSVGKTGTESARGQRPGLYLLHA